MQVCRRLLPVDEANEICERADNAVVLRGGSSLAAKKTSHLPSASSPTEEAGTPLQSSPSPSSIVAPAGGGSVKAAECSLPQGLQQSSDIERDLNELLGGLFQEADTEGKVG